MLARSFDWTIGAEEDIAGLSVAQRAAWEAASEAVRADVVGHDAVDEPELDRPLLVQYHPEDGPLIAIYYHFFEPPLNTVLVVAVEPL